MAIPEVCAGKRDCRGVSEKGPEMGITISEWPDSEKQRLADGWADVINDAIAFAKKEGAPAKWMLDAMDQWLKDNPE
ncbi:MAG: hypothetical protein Ct9H300mP13_1640 [Gammaproteobacteria bacterium]|nr:MAG: hypothetical protein Ct9H300mP13_1640 [Gammaproteobacteria bacterium]